MKVVNIHKRNIQQPIQAIGKLLTTLATKDDRILATNKWPAMRLDNGLQVGSKGGHGPIKYFVTQYQPEKSVTFQFDMTGFNGYHQFELTELNNTTTELSHVIDMETKGFATIKWLFAIRCLHDAYIEDAFDNVENNFIEYKKNSHWSLWVRILRKIMKPKKTIRNSSFR